jgi:hypothetical protein
MGGYGGAERRHDSERRGKVEVALVLADIEASFGDFDQAWQHLDDAEKLSGGALAQRCVQIRRSWYDRESGLSDN